MTPLAKRKPSNASRIARGVPHLTVISSSPRHAKGSPEEMASRREELLRKKKLIEDSGEFIGTFPHPNTRNTEYNKARREAMDGHREDIRKVNEALFSLEMEEKRLKAARRGNALAASRFRN